MIYRSMMVQVICASFEKAVGKWQVNYPTPRAFKVTFSTRTKEGEEGYRYRDLVIYGPMNYVQVWTQERWNVIRTDDLDFDDEGECTGPKKGKDYVQGASEWVKLADHDSCWREGVEKFLKDYEGDVIMIHSKLSDDGWWSPLDPKTLPEG